MEQRHGHHQHRRHPTPTSPRAYAHSHRSSLPPSNPAHGRPVRSRGMMNVNEMLNTNANSSSTAESSLLERLQFQQQQQQQQQQQLAPQAHGYGQMNLPVFNQHAYGHPFMRQPFHQQPQPHPPQTYPQPHLQTRQSSSLASQRPHLQASHAEQPPTQPRLFNDPNRYENEAGFMSSRDHPRQLSELDGSAPPFHPAYDRAAYDNNLQQHTIHNQALSDGHFQYGLLHRNLPESFWLPDHPRQLPRPFLTNPPAMTSAEPSPTCVICFEEKAASEFPYKCPKNCPEQQTCNSCLKDWFIEACRNESRMPPKCCSAEPIPFSSVLHLLSSEQIKLYKSKYEEWSTPNRIYCPVPTCSAFIPPRLYAIPEKPLYVLDPEFNPSQPPQPGLVPTQRPNVECPACYTSICTKCRSFSHRGECKESDIDPSLEKKLKKWKIKRCPKCRAGVRKVFGCSHVQCRCGAHFCFQCLKALNQCFGCEDDDQTEDEEGSRPPQRVLVDEDDLDGRTQFFEGDGHNFGNEPHGGMFLDAWACQHRWAQWGHVLSRPQHTGTLQGPECQTCFLPTSYLQDVLSHIDPDNLRHRQTAWECVRCHVIKCGACIVHNSGT